MNLHDAGDGGWQRPDHAALQRLAEAMGTTLPPDLASSDDGPPEGGSGGFEGYEGFEGVGQNDQEWPDPIYFIGARPHAGMPEGMHGTLVGDIAEMIQDRWGVPPLLTITTAIGVAAAAGRGCYRVELPSGASFPTNLYVGALAYPGSLKSPVVNAVAGPLEPLQQAAAGAHAPQAARDDAMRSAVGDAIKTKTTALSKAVVEGKDTTGIEADLESLHTRQRDLGQPVGCSIITMNGDLTNEALIRRAADNGGKQALISAEGTLIENLAGRYSDGQAKTEFLNSAYDGEPYSMSRVGNSTQVTIDEPWVTLVQVVQPDVLTTMLANEQMRRRGFLQRFWFASIPPTAYRSRQDMPALDAGLLQRWEASVTAIWDSSGTIGPGPGSSMLLDLERDVIAAEADRIDHEHLLYAGWLGKAAMTSVRMAGVLQLADDPHRCDLGSSAAAAAAGYAALMVEHANYLFTKSWSAAASSPRGRVLGWLATTHPPPQNPHNPQNPPTATTRDAFQRFREQEWCSSTDRLRDVLADLASLGWIDGPHKATGDRGGRPSEFWRLHPDLAHHHQQMRGQA